MTVEQSKSALGTSTVRPAATGRESPLHAKILTRALIVLMLVDAQWFCPFTGSNDAFDLAQNGGKSSTFKLARAKPK
ncbi:MULTISPECIES: hypothetical protein [Paraburkholderia]|uniref:hypothetical protein n=1 Tax=Paraburkholderia TaxID=1822464 RepID=UPI0015C5774D|nr:MULTISPECIES: hypothetical protein [Paraburkholderia]MCX4174003.1 hypothetical protein [Paraburkholderia madseniana]MDQ6462007.1 hypothetical protein [Paraburkholderia madseniana]NPT70714.1 hypothetical protein [Paraburkholderia madseniana]